MQDPDEFELIVPPEMIPGVWANTARLSESIDVLTTDFIRIVPFEARGVVVARIALPWPFVGELAESLQGVWQTYVRNSMPPEVRDEDG